ncbi:hypothetical protein ES703_86601 [subsurface metagenome]
MIKNKTAIFAISLTPLFILIILEFLRDWFWTESVLLWIRILFLVLIALPALFGFIPIREKTKLLAAFSDFMLIYYGFVIMLISFNRDILPQMSRWDVSMTGIGVAIIALGIVYLTHKKRELFLEKLNKKIGKIEKTVSKLQPTKTREKKQRK